MRFSPPKSVFITVLLLLTAYPVNADDRILLPEMGDSSSSVLSTAKEMELGAGLMRYMRQQPNFIDDPELNDYLNDLGNRLVTHADRQPYPFTFFMIQEPSINAFAAPGGYIGIHSGLILAAKNEAEVAGVLAHEIAHVTQHHMARAYEAAGRLSIPTAAAMLAAVLVGTQNSQAGQAALMAIQAGSAQYQINFTRTNEKEADRIGIGTLAASGFDPHGMANFFNRMARANRFTGGRPPEFLLTHPVTSDRIAEAQTRADQLSWSASGDTQRFRLAKARLAVITSDRPEELVRRYSADIRDAKNDHASIATARYGLALALQSTGKSADAEKILRSLAHDTPTEPAYPSALGRMLLEQGKARTARDELARGLKSSPDNRTLDLLYARALIESGLAAKASARMDQLIRRSARKSPLPYRLKAEAAARIGQTGEQSLAMAEFYYLNGQTRAAVQQLELGIKTPNLDYILASRLEARLKTLREALATEEKNRDEDNFRALALTP